MEIIQTENLTKKYKRYKKQAGMKGSIKGLFHREYEETIAVDVFDMTIDEGEFVGLIGPNGAGKTTLVKMLTGIIAPTEGQIQVLGYYPNKLEKAYKQQYAVVMGQKSQLFFELTTEDTLKLFQQIYNIPEEQYKKTKSFFVDLFQVKELMNVQVRNLSLGERMKMELIVALLHNPKILFLDEPTIGLDAVASRQIRTFLKDVNETKGTTILLTSHYMEDIKVLCKRSIVVNHGRKIYDGNTDLLFEQYQKSKKMTIYFEDNVNPDIPEYCCVLEKTNDKLVLQIPKEITEKVLEFYIGHYSIRDIGIEEEEIGSVVECIYREV